MEFQAIGPHGYHGTGKVTAARQIKDHDGRLVNVYQIWLTPPDQEPGWLLLGDGEIVRRVEPDGVTH